MAMGREAVHLEDDHEVPARPPGRGKVMKWWAPALMLLGGMTCPGWAFVGCLMFWFALQFGYTHD
jgi:hypothetical protein